MSHTIHAEKARELTGLGRMAEVEGAEAIASGYADYLKDESRLSGGAISLIAFPRDEAGIAAFLRKMNGLGIPVTVSGSRTGIVGGAVPLRGALLSTEKMDRILGLRKGEGENEWYVRVQPGIRVKDLQEKIEKKEIGDPLASPMASDAGAVQEFVQQRRYFFYPVDPTETGASLGGTLATNASGERSYHYGPTRRYVRAARVVLANGDVLPLKRGAVTASPEGSFEIVLTDGNTVPIALPGYKMPSVKNAAGYYVKEGMDLIDLFIGSEGTLGVFSEIELAVIERPKNILSLVPFFPSNGDAVHFFKDARKALPGALVFEYFDSSALDLLRAKKERDGQALAIPPLPEKGRAAIFLELGFESDDDLERVSGILEELLVAHRSSLDDAWSGIEDREREKIRVFRHAMPESVNELVARNKRQCPKVHKMGTDMAVPEGKLEEMITLYESLLTRAGMQYAIFGHIGENHLHVNLLPATEREIEQAKEIIREFAKKAVSFGGTVSAEHGIGKIKHAYLEILYGRNGLEQMAAVKKALDPCGILCRGNIFPQELL